MGAGEGEFLRLAGRRAVGEGKGSGEFGLLGLRAELLGSCHHEGEMTANAVGGWEVEVVCPVRKSGFLGRGILYAREVDH